MMDEWNFGSFGEVLSESFSEYLDFLVFVSLVFVSLD